MTRLQPAPPRVQQVDPVSARRQAVPGPAGRSARLAEIEAGFNRQGRVAQLAALAGHLNGRAKAAAPAVPATIQLQPHASFDPASYAAASTTNLHPLLGAIRALGLAPHSEILRTSLALQGVPDSNLDPEATGNQAHHIVERNDANAQRARTWLARAGIDLESAANGVLLPVAHNDDTGDATVHVGSHVAGYAAEVNRQIQLAINANAGLAGAGITAAWLLVNPCPLAWQPALNAAIVGALGQIRTFLLTHPLPINKGYRVDEDWDPESKDRDKPDSKRGGLGGGKSLKSSFRSVLG